VFFRLQAPGLALIDIALMWITLVILLGKFWKESRLAYWLWLPYFVWVSFATYLNAGFWWLNR
jgi:tryptophan-rich sensory protein